MERTWRMGPRLRGDDEELSQMRDLRTLATRFAGNRRLWQARRARLHHERMVERIPGPRNIGRRRPFVLMPQIIADEVTRDAKLHVAVEEFVILHVDL